MKRILFALAALSLATAAGADDAAAGLFAKRCASCHGKDGKGTPVGQKMGAADLTAATGSEADLANVISNGKGKMTAYKGKLTDAEIQSLAKYVKSGLK
jgi:cytochrome c6